MKLNSVLSWFHVVFIRGSWNILLQDLWRIIDSCDPLGWRLRLAGVFDNIHHLDFSCPQQIATPVLSSIFSAFLLFPCLCTAPTIDCSWKAFWDTWRLPSLSFSPLKCAAAPPFCHLRVSSSTACNILLNYNITPFLFSPGIIFLSSWFQKRGQNRETSSPHHLPQTSFPLWKSTSGVFVQFLSTCSLLHSISNIIKVWDWVRCNTRYWFISFYCLSSLIIIAVFISLKICLTLPLL